MAWRETDKELLSDTLTKNEVVTMLVNHISASNQTMTAFASANNLTTQYVSDVVHYRRNPGETILRVLGLQKEVTYRRWR